MKKVVWGFALFTLCACLSVWVQTAASYPGGVKSFTTKSTADIIQATHINDLQDEVVAIEQALLSTGLAHHLRAALTNTYDLGVSGAVFRDLNLGRNAAIGGTLAVTGNTTLSGTVNGGAIFPQETQGRLTLTTAVPVTSTDVTAAGTLYFTPYQGNRVAIYVASAWTLKTFSEVSLALTLTSGKNYDVFVYDNAGTVAIALSNAWTTDTARGDALTTQDGAIVLSSDHEFKYLGTIRASGSNTTEDSLAKRFVWNYYHRMRRSVVRVDGTDSWTYTTATVRQSNGSTSNQIAVVVGVAEEVLDLRFAQSVTNGSLAAIQVGIGEDATTLFSKDSTSANVTLPASVTIQAHAHLSKVPAIGYHFYPMLEYSSAVGTTTWVGDNGANGSDTAVGGQSGLMGTWGS